MIVSWEEVKRMNERGEEHSRDTKHEARHAVPEPFFNLYTIIIIVKCPNIFLFSKCRLIYLSKSLSHPKAPYITLI